MMKAERLFSNEPMVIRVFGKKQETVPQLAIALLGDDPARISIVMTQPYEVITDKTGWRQFVERVEAQIRLAEAKLERA